MSDQPTPESPTSTHVFEGTPDARQSADPAMPTSRFRPAYRALGADEKALHDAIKKHAEMLLLLYTQIAPTRRAAGRNEPVYTPDGLPPAVPGRYLALATTELESSVMWAVKALTT
jgi:hypothetical protein